MKKSVFVIVATMFLMSCGGSPNSAVATDSTVVDSTKVVDSAVAATDSTVAQIPADSTGGFGPLSLGSNPKGTSLTN